METLEKTAELTRKPAIALSGNELGLLNLNAIENPNVRRIALNAKDQKERLNADASYKIQGTYSEAYSGERA